MIASFLVLVQLSRTSTSAKLNVLLDATSPLLNCIFILETISDADAEMSLFHIASIIRVYYTHIGCCCLACVVSNAIKLTRV